MTSADATTGTATTGTANGTINLPPQGVAVPDLELIQHAEIPDPTADAGVVDSSLASPPTYFASVTGPGATVPTRFAAEVLRLEALLGRPVWLLVQRMHDHSPLSQLDEPVRQGFLRDRAELRKCPGVALVIDSPGGSAATAFQIASMLRRHCGGFQAIVPRYAKSAATLLAIGGTELFLGPDAELGPLDAQLMDADRESWSSALDEIQSLERLNAAALVQFDEAMMVMLQRTGKKIDTLIPYALKYATDMMRPLLEKIDTVHYTQQSRVLKVAEDYATRLLQGTYDLPRAEEIARILVNSYPEHGFVIDRDEAATFLDIAEASPEQNACIESMEEILISTRFTAIGRLVEEKPA